MVYPLDLPSTSSPLNGILQKLSTNIEYTTFGTSDEDYAYCPFRKNCTTTWGAKDKNDYLEIRFIKHLVYLTNYSIQGGNARIKGWFLDAKDVHGHMHRIDSVADALVNSVSIDIMTVNNHGPFKSFRFVATDTWQSLNGWFATIRSIDFFGSIFPITMLIHISKNRFFVEQKLLLVSIVCISTY